MCKLICTPIRSLIVPGRTYPTYLPAFTIVWAWNTIKLSELINYFHRAECCIFQAFHRVCQHWLRLRIRMVFNTTFKQYFSYIMAVRFYRGGNLSTREKPQTCRKPLTKYSQTCFKQPPKGRSKIGRVTQVTS